MAGRKFLVAKQRIVLSVLRGGVASELVGVSAADGRGLSPSHWLKANCPSGGSQDVSRPAIRPDLVARKRDSTKPLRS